MPYIVADRVRDTSTSAGPTVFTVTGTAPIGFRTFSAVCATSDVLPVFIQHRAANEWIVALAMYSAANQLTLQLVLSSSAGGTSTVTFSSGIKDIVLGTPASREFARPSPIVLPQGRLTLTAGTPVMTADAAAQTTIRYTPYTGRIVPINDGHVFYAQDIGAELTQTTTDTTKSPAAVAANSNYDLFVWNDAGTVRCTRGPAWTSSTARGTGASTTELAQINGVYVNAVAITNGPGQYLGTYVGTVRSNGSSQIDYKLGTAASGTQEAFLGIWNMYNRVNAVGAVCDATGSWSNSTSAFAPANGSTQNRVSIIRGLNDDAVQASFVTRISGTVGYYALGIGIDSTTVVSPSPNGAYNLMQIAFTGSVLAFWGGLPGLGFHYFQALEIGDGTNSWAVNGYPYFSLQAMVRL